MTNTDLPLPVMRSGIELVPTRAEGDPPETGKLSLIHIPSPRD